MTDEMRAREKAICEAAKVDDIGEVSDGFHTFNSLYEQRMILFAALVKAYKDKSWKSYRHEDGEYCFGGGWFIVGIDTPEGSYTYHYENKYWDMFDCTDLPRAKHWDGHTEKDVTRLLSLSPAQPEPCEDAVSREAVSSWLKQYGQDVLHGKYKFSLMYIWKNLMDLPSAQPEPQWIPFKTRPLTEEEQDEHPEWDCILDCKLPDDGQVILVSINLRGHERVQYDEFYTDDGSYLDSGYAIGAEATAWMPLPEPWEGEGNERA